LITLLKREEITENWYHLSDTSDANDSVG